MKKERYDNQWTEKSTSVYLIALFLIFPLLFHKNYIGILEARTTMFVIITVVYLAFFVVLFWLEKSSREKADRKPKNKKQSAKKKNRKHDVIDEAEGSSKEIVIQDIFFAVLVAAVIIAMLCSGDIPNIWSGAECKLFGAKIILLCCGAYYAVSKGYILNQYVKISLAAGAGIVFLLAVLHRYGFDPLKIQIHLTDGMQNMFMSTIGNVNILSGFVCVFLPIFMGAFIYSEGLVEKIVSAVLVYAAVMAGFATNADSFFLGWGISLLVFLWFCMGAKEKLAEYLMVCAVCAAAVMSMRLFVNFDGYGVTWMWARIQNILINEIPWLIVIAVLAAVVVLLKKANFDANWIMIRRIVFIIIGLCFAAVAIYIIKVNVSGDESANPIFVFNDAWGSGRGFVWAHTFDLFRELPIHQQLIGVGPGGFRDFFEACNIEGNAMGLPTFVDPHSEVLYYLVSTGIIGVIAYVGMIVTALVTCFKAGSKNAAIFAAAVLSYSAQAAVNGPIVMTAPYLFLFLAMIRYELRNEMPILKRTHK